MGMMTRVRRRVRANSLRIDKAKTAQSVCLLSAVLLLPYCPRSPLPLLPSPAPMLYSAFVLPVVFSANYRYPLTTFKPVIRFIQGGTSSRLCYLLWGLLRAIYRPVERAEDLFLEMKNISVMVNQILFLLLADRALLPRQKMTCLYTLMFYNVTAYCVNYIKELIEKEDWSPYVTLTERSKIKHLAMSATKIVLEWTKAVTFAVTLTFMLLVFGLEQGLEHYKPSMSYTVVTWAYYAATERVFVQMFPRILLSFRLEALENMENLYAPVLLGCFTIGLSTLLILSAIPSVTSWRFLLVVCYLNVYLSTKELMRNSGAALKREREVLARYRKATPREIERFDDVCPVCLYTMSKARVTPCHHLFHADCLRQCLKNSNNCPMCKRELTFCRL